MITELLDGAFSSSAVFSLPPATDVGAIIDRTDGATTVGYSMFLRSREQGFWKWIEIQDQMCLYVEVLRQ